MACQYAEIRACHVEASTGALSTISQPTKPGTVGLSTFIVSFRRRCRSFCKPGRELVDGNERGGFRCPN
jgi:hypothetical protein